MERKEGLKFGGASMSLPVELSCLQGIGGAEGEAEGEAALSTLEKQLICPICLELFNKPVVILPCQHNLCRKCANELYQPSLFQARTTMMINSGRFRCPSCRHEVVLDRHGVYGLPRNLLVENIIDVYKQEVSNFNNKAASAVPPPPPPPPSADLTCSDHEGEKVNIYCLTCKVPTCSLCKVFGAHQSCKVAPLSDIYQLQKDELAEEVNSLKEYNEKVQALIDDLEQSCRNIEENTKTQKQKVTEQFDHILSILDERRKAMTERITSEQEEKTGHAQALIRCYGDSVQANNQLMERATSSMEEPDMAAFVQSSREHMAKVIAAASFSPVETLKPGYESLSHYRFNFSKQEEALRNIDFPKLIEDVPEEPESETEPESEPEEEPKLQQEVPRQNLESTAEPVPALTPSPVEPVQTSAPRPAAGPQRDPVDPEGADLQPEGPISPELNNRGSGESKKKTEERRPADSVKEESDQQDGMTTLQCEEGEGIQGDARDWTERETEDKCDTQEKKGQVKEAEFQFCPNVRQPNSLNRILQTLKVEDAGQKIDSPEESKMEAGSEPPIQPQHPENLDSQTQEESMPRSDLPHGSVHPTKQEREAENQDNMQDSACEPEGLQSSLNPGEAGLDLMKLGLVIIAENNKNPTPTAAGEDDSEENGGGVEDAEDVLGLKCASDLRERPVEQVDHGAKKTEKELKEDRKHTEGRSAPEEDDEPTTEDGSGPQNGSADDPERTNVSARGHKMESKYAASLQVITLIFYLFAFLVILQRFWPYISIFICI